MIKKITKKIHKHIIPNKGFYVMNCKWDNLIILDACRFDMFSKFNTFKGELKLKKSRGSATNQFLKENFANRNFDDTVYITSNPLVDFYCKDVFYKIIPVWKDNWNDSYGTVTPDVMTNLCIEASDEYLDKRIIMHYVQPHYPFLGKLSHKLLGRHEGMKSRDMLLNKSDHHHGKQAVWSLLEHGKVSKRDVWISYIENLLLVLESLKKLISKLKGITVITSDHGNLLGERVFPFYYKEYGHPSEILHSKLVDVPWFILPNNGTRKIHKGQPEELIKEADYDDQLVKSLTDLGYM